MEHFCEKMTRSGKLRLVCLLGLLVCICGGCTLHGPPPDPLLLVDELVLQNVHGATTSPTESLAIGSYNFDWLMDAPRIRSDLARLGHVNVWCFQEMRFGDGTFEAGGNQAKAQLESVLPPGAWYIAVIRANRLRELRSRDWEAQVIASRFPLNHAAVWELDATGPKRRVALAVQVMQGDQTVLVVNTDHEPSYLPFHDGNSQQVHELCAKLATTDLPVIVAGDFNCAGRFWGAYGNQTHVARIDNALAEIGLAPVGLAGSTFHFGLLPFQLDRIYTRGLIVTQCKVDTSATGSDHQPVWCKVRIAGKQ